MVMRNDRVLTILKQSPAVLTEFGGESVKSETSKPLLFSWSIWTTLGGSDGQNGSPLENFFLQIYHQDLKW
jgi:hypothetical protein